jgi:hypothetical protein
MTPSGSRSLDQVAHVDVNPGTAGAPSSSSVHACGLRLSKRRTTHRTGLRAIAHRPRRELRADEARKIAHAGVAAAGGRGRADAPVFRVCPGAVDVGVAPGKMFTRHVLLVPHRGHHAKRTKDALARVPSVRHAAGTLDDEAPGDEPHVRVVAVGTSGEDERGSGRRSADLSPSDLVTRVGEAVRAPLR